jgi:hypothetical protein
MALILVFVVMVGGSGGGNAGTEKELMAEGRKSTKTISSI